MSVTFPRPSIIYAMAVAFGFVSGLMIILIVMTVDDQVYNVEQLRDVTGVRCFGTLKIGRRPALGIQIVAQSRTLGRLFSSNEQQLSNIFKEIRRCFFSAVRDDKQTVIGFASYNCDIERNVVVLGVALAHARNLSRTLLVNADGKSFPFYKSLLNGITEPSVNHENLVASHVSIGGNHAFDFVSTTEAATGVSVDPCSFPGRLLDYISRPECSSAGIINIPDLKDSTEYYPYTSRIDGVVIVASLHRNRKREIINVIRALKEKDINVIGTVFMT